MPTCPTLSIAVFATTLSMLPCRRRGCPTPQPQSDFLPTDIVIFAANRNNIRDRERERGRLSGRERECSLNTL